VQRLHLHTKIVLLTTGFLIVFGTICVFAMEYTNNATIGALSLSQKLLASLFQSITTRTAGFFTFSQSNLRSSTVLVCLFLMFIGGSSIGTAGGIKTTTFAALALSTLSTVRGKKHLVVFRKTIPHKTVQKALAVTFVSFIVLCVAIAALSVVENGSLTDIAYEATSAIATVGLTRDYTSHLHFFGKIIIIFCMYLGRIGPISMAIAFTNHENPSGLSYPHEDITVG
jgi:trk system potassium uptake protein TrkH